MKYSAGLANRAVIGGNGFLAGEREGSGRSGLRAQAAGHPRREEGVGSQDRGEEGLEPRAEGCLSTTLTLVESYQHMRVSVYACVCVCVCACVYVRRQDSFLWESLSSSCPFTRGQEGSVV